MHAALCPTLAVVGIFYIYRMYMHWIWQKRCVLRERVAYMLWVASDYVR